jgi:hypothetical protein
LPHGWVVHRRTYYLALTPNLSGTIVLHDIAPTPMEEMRQFGLKIMAQATMLASPSRPATIWRKAREIMHWKREEKGGDEDGERAEEDQSDR